MSIGQEGDDRQYRRLKTTDWYATKSAFKQKPAKQEYCKTCGRPLEPYRKSWDGYCLQCHDEKVIE